MTDKEMEHRWAPVVREAKAMTVSEMIHNHEVGIPYNPGSLRGYLIQRAMERHGFTEEQALAEILAFGG
jgi:hypothetical protein